MRGGNISIHAPTRGATVRYQQSEQGSRISIHAPTRGATDYNKGATRQIRISIHAPTRGATIRKRICDSLTRISIHAPTRGATIQGAKGSGNGKYFNPRSHKGSDGWIVKEFIKSLISIHAPTRGATKSAPTDIVPEGLFQSTLPQGERQQFYTKFHICFISFLPILSPYHISTHSPLPTFNHFLYIFSGANRPEISCLLPFRTKTISGIL